MQAFDVGIALAAKAESSCNDRARKTYAVIADKHVSVPEETKL